MNPIDQLKSVLCDPEGKCCISGSDEDRAIIDRALRALAEPAVEPRISTEHCSLAERQHHQASVNYPSDDLYCPRCQCSERFLQSRRCEPHIVYDAPSPPAALAEPAMEPVAVRYDFDGYGWRYVDNGSGSDWLERGMKLEDAELVYTVPAPAAKPAVRSGVFRYIDEQVRKDMSGFYAAFGMQQPPPPAELAEPAVEPVGWPAGSAELHAGLLQMGKSMAKERSREIGDAWNQLADLLALLAKARRTAAPTPPAEVPLLTPDEVALMWVAESFDTLSPETCYIRGVKRGEQAVRQKAGL